MFVALGGSPQDLNKVKLKLLHDSIGNSVSAPEAEVKVDGVNVFRSPPPPMTLPDELITLEEGLLESEPVAIAVAKYILNKRHIQVDPTTVFVAITKDRKNPWLDRMIMPIVMWNKVVGLTGRDITNRHPSKYYIDGPKGKAIFNHDAMMRHPDRPLFIFEGQFDALRVDGVALMGRTITPHQQHWIERSGRKPIVVPDKGKDGLELARSALALGWSLSLPDIGSNKDVDEAVPKFGKLYCLDQLLSTVISGELADTKAQLYCLGGA